MKLTKTSWLMKNFIKVDRVSWEIAKISFVLFFMSILLMDIVDTSWFRLLVTISVIGVVGFFISLNSFLIGIFLRKKYIFHRDWDEIKKHRDYYVVGFSKIPSEDEIKFEIVFLEKDFVCLDKNKYPRDVEFLSFSVYNGKCYGDDGYSLGSFSLDVLKTSFVSGSVYCRPKFSINDFYNPFEIAKILIMKNLKDNKEMSYNPWTYEQAPLNEHQFQFTMYESIVFYEISEFIFENNEKIKYYCEIDLSNKEKDDKFYNKKFIEYIMNNFKFLSKASNVEDIFFE